MSEDPLAKLRERDRAMRGARDEILRRVGDWLRFRDFSRAGAGHFTKSVGERVHHIGFQKLTSGRGVRVTCRITGAETGGDSIVGPRSDPYEGRDSPNGRRYQFAWNTREPDIARSAAEYCRYLDEVVFNWFDEQLEDQD